AVALACVPAAVAASPATKTAATTTAPASTFHRDRTPLPASVGDADGGDAERQPSSSGGSAVARMLGGLAVVLAVIFGVYWLLKTFGRSRGLQSDERMTVLATTSLSASRTLHLVRVGEEIVLLGSGEQSVTPIRVYTQEEARRLGLEPERQTTFRALEAAQAQDARGLLAR